MRRGVEDQEAERGERQPAQNGPFAPQRLYDEGRRGIPADGCDAAQKQGRKMAFAGTSMVDNVKVARKLGYLEIPDEAIVPIDQAMKMQLLLTW